MPAEVVQHIEFQCPKCGSSQFGSSQKPDGAGRVYYCQGEYRCGFRWDGAEYWKHMQLVTRQSFSSEEEYERIFSQLNNGEGVAAGVPQ